jgi:hypothetical protein
MITANRLKLAALPALLLAGSAVHAQVGQMMLRQFATASGSSTWQQFYNLDANELGQCAVTARVSSSSEFDTLVWYYDGSGGDIRFREGQTDLTCLPFTVGAGVEVKAGNMKTDIALNNLGDVGYIAQLAIECDDPDDPACDFNGRNAFIYNDAYTWGGADGQIGGEYMCGSSSTHNDVDIVNIQGPNSLIGRLRTGSISKDDQGGWGFCLDGTPQWQTLFCEDETFGLPVGEYSGDIIEEQLHTLRSNGKWYALLGFRNVPTSENRKVVYDGDVILSRGDEVFVFPDLTTPVEINNLELVKMGADELPLWSGSVGSNDVVGFGRWVIATEGEPTGFTEYPDSTWGGSAVHSLAVDDAGNILVAWSITATIDDEQQVLDVLVYNGELVMATGDTIDINNNGTPDDGNSFDQFLPFTKVDVGNRVAWVICEANLSLGLRDIVMRVTGLPFGSNPYLTQPPFEKPCKGDLDNDGDVDLSDLGILLASFEVDDGGDTNGDGVTDLSDLGTLLAEFEVCFYTP